MPLFVLLGVFLWWPDEHQCRQCHGRQQRDVKVWQAAEQALLLETNVEQLSQDRRADEAAQHLDHANERIQTRIKLGLDVVRDGRARKRAIRRTERRDEYAEYKEMHAGTKALHDAADHEEEGGQPREEEVLGKDGEAGAGHEQLGDEGHAAEDDDGHDAERGEQDGRLAEGPAVRLADVLHERLGVGGDAGVLEEERDEQDGHAGVAQDAQRGAQVGGAAGHLRAEAGLGVVVVVVVVVGLVGLGDERLGEDEEDEADEGLGDDDDPDGHPGAEARH